MTSDSIQKEQTKTASNSFFVTSEFVFCSLRCFGCCFVVVVVVVVVVVALMTSDFQFAVIDVDEISENKLKRTLFFLVVFRKRQNFGKSKSPTHSKKSRLRQHQNPTRKHGKNVKLSPIFAIVIQKQSF